MCLFYVFCLELVLLSHLVKGNFSLLLYISTYTYIYMHIFIRVCELLCSSYYMSINILPCTLLFSYVSILTLLYMILVEIIHYFLVPSSI